MRAIKSILSFSIPLFWWLQIILGIPTIQQRQAMLVAICGPLPRAADVDLQYLGEATPGFVAADLASLVQQAWYAASKQQQVL